jgi:hypothetical protein
MATPNFYREGRLGRFRCCCRFRSFHLAFWLLLSFARDALVHLFAIACSGFICGQLGGLGRRPFPPQLSPDFVA